MTYKLNTIRGDNKQLIKKLNELTKDLKVKNNISQDKDYEVSFLLGKINSLRELVNYGQMELPEDELNKYVENLKNKENYNYIFENEKEDSKKNENENLSKDINNDIKAEVKEESIQADFPDSEDVEKEDEEEEKVVKEKKEKGKSAKYK